MIPPDVASSLRTALTDAHSATQQPQQTQPVVPAQRIADVLGNLVPGQRILAEVQGMLANGTYRALAGQREITLALPFAAKPGDSLELEVTESDGKLTLAFVANRGEQAARGQGTSVATSLSNAGKMIGDLLQDLTVEGRRAPAAPLNGNQALVRSMPNDAAQLVPILKQALSNSGMFYEAHQARWVGGHLPTEQLRQEPQGRLPPQLPASEQGGKQAASANTPPLRDMTTPPSQPGASTLPSPAPLAAGMTQMAGAPQASPPSGSPAPAPGNPAPSAGQPQSAAAAGTPAGASASPASASATGSVTPLSPSAVTPATPATPSTFAGLTPVIQQGTLVYEVLPPRNAWMSAPPTVATPAPTSGPANTTPQPPAPQPGGIPLAPLGERSPAQAAPADGGRGMAVTSTDTHAVTNDKPPAAQPPAQGIPREVAGLVQQQLDGLANQNYAWQGQIWPGQELWWEIGEEEQRNGKPEEEGNAWQTRLKLTLPGLGEIDARILLQGNESLTLRIAAADLQGVERLRDRLDELRLKLEDAGMNVRQLLVDHGQESQERPAA